MPKNGTLMTTRSILELWFTYMHLSLRHRIMSLQEARSQIRNRVHLMPEERLTCKAVQSLCLRLGLSAPAISSQLFLHQVPYNPVPFHLNVRVLSSAISRICALKSAYAVTVLSDPTRGLRRALRRDPQRSG